MAGLGKFLSSAVWNLYLQQKSWRKMMRGKPFVRVVTLQTFYVFLF